MDVWQAGLFGVLVIMGPVILGVLVVGLPVLLTAREHHRRYGRPLLDDWSSVSAGPALHPDRDPAGWVD